MFTKTKVPKQMQIQHNLLWFFHLYESSHCISKSKCCKEIKEKNYENTFPRNFFLSQLSDSLKKKSDYKH